MGLARTQVARTQVARTQVSWGSLCYWTWRLLFMFILVSSFCSLSLIFLVYIGQKRSGMTILGIK